MATVHVRFEERYWYPDDGGIVWLAGFSVVDPDTGRFVARDALPEDLRVAQVAGAFRHPDALASDAAAPGCPLVLRPEPDNEHDPNAVAVDLPGGEHLGYVPRELAAELAEQAADWTAVVLRESRRSPRDPRTGVTMLLARSPELTLQT